MVLRGSFGQKAGLYSPFRIVLVVAVAAALTLGGCRSKGVPDADGYEYRPSSSRGTGKFYMGREIARTVDHTSASWLDRPSREAEELPGRLVRVLGLEGDDLVADIGAGTGYMTFRISPLVPRGKVYAVDIDPEMLRILEQRADSMGLENVVPVRGTERSTNLPTDSLDLILIVDAYHEFSYPLEMARSMRASLRKGGRLVLVEYRAEDSTVPIHPLHRMTEAQARSEMKKAGLEWDRTLSVLPQQHILIFKKL